MAAGQLFTEGSPAGLSIASGHTSVMLEHFDSCKLLPYNAGIDYHTIKEKCDETETDA